MNSNENEQKGLKSLRNYGIVFAVLAVALIVSGLFLAVNPLNEFSKRLSWKQTEGEIFGFEKVLTDQKSSEQNFIAIVDFPFGKDNFVEVKSDPQKELPVINNKVKVFYDEKDPQGAVIGEYSFMKLIPFLVLLILGVISAVFSFISFRKMKDLKKQKNEVQNQTNNSAFLQNFTHNNKVQK